jgi:hypothetical protein
MQFHRDYSHRRLNAMTTRLNSLEIGQGDGEANGSMTAHPEIADIIEEDDAR